MYYVAYLWGCNKLEPKLIKMSTDLDNLKTNLAKNADVSSFEDIIDDGIMADYFYEINGSDEENSEASNKITTMDGPATEYNDNGEEYFVIVTVFKKLLGDTYYDVRWASCGCHLSIFAIEDINNLNFDELKGYLYNHIH